MRDVIASVADLIGSELGRARARIAEGRTELKAEVDKLPDDLKALGKEKAGEFEQKFEELGESVNEQGPGARPDPRDEVHRGGREGRRRDRGREGEEQGPGVEGRLGAVGGVIKTIMQLKDMLLGVLAKAASAVMAIIKDPIGFLGNLVSAVGAGLQAFLSNIVEHLKKGLFGWLLGAASSMGLELPKTFDLKGILGMLATLFGLTWSAIKGRIVQRALKVGIPQRAIGAIEAGVTIVQKLRTQGLSGVIEEVKDKLGDLKENLVGKLTEYLVPTVLKAGIIWIVSLLNPASAFVKACKAIIDFVTFIVERGAQIMEFVGSVLDAVIAIAKGGGGGVPALVEKALARSVPVLIGALAALLGIGGIANKVKEFIQSLSKPVMSAVEWVVDKVVTLGKGIWARMKSAFKRKKPKKANKEDVRRKAGELVGARLQGKPKLTEADVDAVVASVRAELAPEGLRSLNFGKPNAEGVSKLLASASPSKVVGAKQGPPKKPKTPTKTVVLRATVTLSESAGTTLAAGRDGAPRFFDYVLPRRTGDKRGGVPGLTGVQKAALITDVPPSQTKVGAFLVQPEQAADKKLTVVSFNSGEPVPQTNDSHAERFLVKWFEGNPNIAAKAVAVDIDINLSPCSRCAPALAALARPGLSLTLTYSKAYENVSKEGILYDNTTTSEDRACFTSPEWTVHGPMPKWTDASKKAAIEAGTLRWLQRP